MASAAAALASRRSPPPLPGREDFDITSVLGKGAYGKVFQVRNSKLEGLIVPQCNVPEQLS